MIPESKKWFLQNVCMYAELEIRHSDRMLDFNIIREVGFVSLHGL